MTTQNISKWSIHCTTENATVSGWSPSSLNYCPNNNSHTVDTSTVALLETILNPNYGGVSTVINQWQIFCNTEGQFVSGWNTHALDKCPNNGAHSINLNSLQVLNTVQNNQVIIQQNSVPMNGNFKVEAISFSGILPYDSQTINYAFPVQSSMYSFWYSSDDTNAGDQITIKTPATTLGLITGNITAGDTIINVPSTVIQYASVGFYLDFTDGTHYDESTITAIDKVNNRVTMSPAISHSYSSSNTIVQMSMYIMKSLTIGSPALWSFGTDIVGGTLVPKNMTVQFIYKNNALGIDLNTSPKSLVLYMEIIY